MKGRFITFEGTEGCGKSTQLARLAKRLRADGAEVVVTREPGGTPLGEDIRHLLKHADSGQGMCPEAEVLLFAASRAQHVRAVIRPALAAGKTVLCDRFLDSTTVYQGAARKLPADQVAALNAFAVEGCLPDMTFVLDIPAEVGLQRAWKRTCEAPDRMEQEELAFYQAVRQGFLDLAAAEPERFAVIDGTLKIDAVSAAIDTALSQKFST
ncbi:dTMP kinase [Ruficoccus sp. ZRK36]|uniref:dTMP kinase n=1 Tax=Ruficoccus sp. ZRK36 TaxID=2866311 RepID=UPI001C736C5F|nr:dTMP kinase [Ruficoccus sp. ZRK36]QYY34894.1 dTMP kinase [Ruficoccus sp. ZRK36]